MQGWMRGWCVLGLALLAACGNGDGGETETCPALGTSIVRSLQLGFAEKQVRLEVRFITLDAADLSSLSLTFSGRAEIVPSAGASNGGTNCGPSTGTSTNVVGGAAGENVIVPESTSGAQRLPLIKPTPVMATTGVNAFTNLGGPGQYQIAAADRQALTNIPVVPGGQNLPSVPGTTGVSLAFDMLDPGALTILLSLIQTRSSARIITSPQLVTLDGQEATFLAGNELAPINMLEPEWAQRAIAMNTGAAAAEVGVVLDVRPRITPGGMIELNIAPETEAMQLTATNQPFLLGGSVPSVPVVPVLKTRQVTSRIVISDGQTVVIGGIFNPTTTQTTNTVPFFGRLPVLGSFARMHRQLDLDNNLLVFITAAKLEY